MLLLLKTTCILQQEPSKWRKTDWHRKNSTYVVSCSGDVNDHQIYSKRDKSSRVRHSNTAHTGRVFTSTDVALKQPGRDQIETDCLSASKTTIYQKLLLWHSTTYSMTPTLFRRRLISASAQHLAIGLIAPPTLCSRPFDKLLVVSFERARFMYNCCLLYTSPSPRD